MKLKDFSGKIGLFIVAIIWGTGFVATSFALDYFTPFQIIALRFTLAFFVSLLIYFKEVKTGTKEQFRKGGTIGIFLFLAFMFQTIGLQYTTASKNAFLTAVNIVIVPFLSWVILKERIPKKSLIGAIVTLGGISFMSLDFSNLTTLNNGDLLTLICALFFALQIFYTDYYVKNVKAGIIMVSQMGVAALLSWIAVFLFGETQMTINWITMQPILYLGIMSTMVAFGLQTWAQQRTSSTETAVILSTEAFFGMIGSVLLLGENITTVMIIGAVLIFIGILIVEIGPKKSHLELL